MDALEIIRQLQQDSALRAQMRAVLLGEELLSLPELVQENSRQIAALTAKMDQVEEQIAALTTKMERVEEQIAALTSKMDQVERRLGRVEDRLGSLDGKFTEETYRRTFASRVRRVEGGLRIDSVLSSRDFDAILDSAVDSGLISEDEADRLALSDTVALGHMAKTGEQVAVVGEIASTVHIDDVLRALERAEIAARATGRRAVPVVMGQKAEVIRDALHPGVWLIENHDVKELLGDLG